MDMRKIYCSEISSETKWLPCESRLV